MVAGLFARGWVRFPAEAAVETWAHAARAAALLRMADPAHREEWLQCEGTWFVGVDTLPNDAAGAVPGGPPLAGAAIDAARDIYGDLPLHRGQVSVVYPGYPRPRKGEGEGAFRYRLRRDAAHVDGLHATGPERRRRLIERHAWIMGLPLGAASPGASPLVVWEGSHEIMRTAFRDALAGIPPERWAEVDLTEPYQAARREAFETCARVELAAAPGEAYLVHRLALHGVAPWGEGATAARDGRMIAYFRPEFEGNDDTWLSAP
ncbi:hypothetical protein K1T73_15475 [Roseovarius sp. SCSIO 43702]|uniref:hypothetical protein n=1 Tax=Roseovarius sp. SCSIO 43702 TaxID=2823043 RepID=UPI001C73BD80|nr:hypothetical protein [Roseovarius sp. SCSIO 43702]QYX56434.1 hypothetical protein K1T73_15475 [Roseovarius sp. SCSIO 43702]